MSRIEQDTTMIQQQLIEHCVKQINRNADRDTYGKRFRYTEHFVLLRFLKGETIEQIFKNPNERID